MSDTAAVLPSFKSLEEISAETLWNGSVPDEEC